LTRAYLVDSLGKGIIGMMLSGMFFAAGVFLTGLVSARPVSWSLSGLAFVAATYASYQAIAKHRRLVRTLERNPAAIVWICPGGRTERHGEAVGRPRDVVAEPVLVLHTSGGREYALPCKEVTKPILRALANIAPEAIYGYSQELQRLYAKSPKGFRASAKGETIAACAGE
jgi:hypothetical protein